MGAAREAVLGIVLGSGVAGACAGASAYACTSDEQCTDGGAGGQCEQSGYCSFGDDACPSGRRYGMLAPADLANECTTPDADTEGVDTIVTTSIGSGSEDESTSTMSPASSASMTSTPVETSTTSETSGIDPTDLVTAGESSESSTSGPTLPSCAVTISDEFDDGVLDPVWGSWASAQCWFSEADGIMSFSVAPSADEWLSAGLTNGPAPFLGGYVRTRLVPYQPPLDAVGVWLTAYHDTCELQITLEGEVVHGKAGDVWLDGVDVASDAPVWLQIRSDLDGIAYWEWSTNGMTWNLLHSEPSPCDLDSMQSALFAGGTHENADPILRSVESYERCDPT